KILHLNSSVERITSRTTMGSVQKITRIVLMLTIAFRLVAQLPPYKFSTTVVGEPLYTFGTTVAANSGFRGEIYHIDDRSLKLPDFSKLKPVGVIFTPYLCTTKSLFLCAARGFL